jgi:hypothetical protein
VTEKLYRRLPFSVSAGAMLLDVLYFIIDKFPAVLSPGLITRLREFTKHAPDKILVLFALRFRHRPTSIFADFLIENSADFSKPIALSRYLSLLLDVLTKTNNYSDQFPNSVSKILHDNLVSESKEILALCYNGFCLLFDLNGIAPPVKVPILVNHLLRDEVHDSVISYLLRMPPSRGQIWPLLDKLIDYARTSNRCFHVLLAMSDSPDIARQLVEHPQWMTFALTDVKCTMNLFCHVFAHRELRELMAKNEVELARFFLLTRRMRRDEDVSVSISDVCLILRKLEVSPKLVQLLSQNDFIPSFFRTALAANEDFSALLILAKFALVAPFPQIVGMCPFVVEKFKWSGKKVPKAAARAGLAMCAYQQCMAQFQAQKIADWLIQNRRTGSTFAHFLHQFK